MASLVALDQVLVDENGTAARGQAQDKRLVGSGIEGIDALWW